MIAQCSDVAKGLSEPQLLDDRFAGRFLHFLGSVVREDRRVAIRCGDLEVASFAGFEGHPLGLQPSPELAVLHHLISLLGWAHYTTGLLCCNRNVVFDAQPNSGLFVSGSRVFFPAPSGLMRIEEPDCFARPPRAFYSWSHEWPSQHQPARLLSALPGQA